MLSFFSRLNSATNSFRLIHLKYGGDKSHREHKLTTCIMFCRRLAGATACDSFFFILYCKLNKKSINTTYLNEYLCSSLAQVGNVRWKVGPSVERQHKGRRIHVHKGSTSAFPHPLMATTAPKCITFVELHNEKHEPVQRACLRQLLYYGAFQQFMYFLLTH